eukprot:SAG22_NODE_721_length_7648_cov_9.418466_1_plen_200_part_10
MPKRTGSQRSSSKTPRQSPADRRPRRSPAVSLRNSTNTTPGRRSRGGGALDQSFELDVPGGDDETTLQSVEQALSAIEAAEASVAYIEKAADTAGEHARRLTDAELHIAEVANENEARSTLLEQILSRVASVETMIAQQPSGSGPIVIYGAGAGGAGGMGLGGGLGGLAGGLGGLGGLLAGRRHRDVGLLPLLPCMLLCR